MSRRDIVRPADALPTVTVRAPISTIVDDAAVVLAFEMKQARQRIQTAKVGLNPAELRKFVSLVKSLEAVREMELAEEKRADWGSQSPTEIFNELMKDPDFRAVAAAWFEAQGDE